MTATRIHLRDIAYTRSGDKGANANIGVIAFDQQGYALLQKYLTAERVDAYFKPLGVIATLRYELPNLLALNFVLHGVLDGGGSLSLRLDSQGKALGQALMEIEMEIADSDLNGKENISSLIHISHPFPFTSQITLNRPDKRNAFNLQMLEELTAAIATVHADRSQRLLLLSASGSAFCTGMDLNEATDVAKLEKSAQLIASCFKELYYSRVLTIAAVQGIALGGGAGLASACDLVIASENAAFGFPEVQRGLVPAQVSALIVRQIGFRQARALLLTGEIVQAGEAKVLGLVNNVVPHESLFSEVQKAVQGVYKCAPGAIAQTKRLLETFDPISFEHDIDHALTFHREARTSPEAKEGIAAFFEKRPPSWYSTISDT